MRGRLDLESSPGGGTTRRSSRSRVPRRGSGRSVGDPRPARRLLIVEDDDVLRARLARAFRRGGSKVGGGRLGRSGARGPGESPSHALVDLRLPDASGLEVVRALIVADPEMSVVVLTGYRQHCHGARGGPAGGARTTTRARRRGPDPLCLRPCPVGTPARPSPVPDPSRVEWEHINRVLADCGGNISEVAAQRSGSTGDRSSASSPVPAPR